MACDAYDTEPDLAKYATACSIDRAGRLKKSINDPLT